MENELTKDVQAPDFDVFMRKISLKHCLFAINILPQITVFTGLAKYDIDSLILFYKPIFNHISISSKSGKGNRRMAAIPVILANSVEQEQI